jgi:hypothetical protein
VPSVQDGRGFRKFTTSTNLVENACGIHRTAVIVGPDLRGMLADTKPRSSVADDKFWFHRERAGDADALFLPAGQLTRQPVRAPTISIHGCALRLRLTHDAMLQRRRRRTDRDRGARRGPSRPHRAMRDKKSPSFRRSAQQSGAPGPLILVGGFWSACYG